MLVNRAREKLLLEILTALPHDRISEVEDFADFLRMRTEVQHLTRAAAMAAKPAFGSYSRPMRRDGNLLTLIWYSGVTVGRIEKPAVRRILTQVDRRRHLRSTPH